ncbi:hypothetical protein M758_7G140500 [Ceratodon purpureus]|nr:hypothetical protein M758_7G140500 [Ceratodon purpureus]
MGKRRVAVFAFGTRGDVLPVAVVAAALARADPSSSITFITHEAHRNMETHLARSGVARFVAVLAPPVVPGREVAEIAHSMGAREDDGEVKAALEMQVREECIAAMDSVMGDGGDGCVIINLFALEGWHLAELYRVPCAVLAPYVVPYSAPSSFERRFRATHPLLYRLKEATPGEVGWEEVMHWMWPLFTDRWASWRTHRLHLSACPLTDPVTDLPLMHEWPQASRLLYGFSPQVVECPAYWPRSISVCGFWYAPVEWEVRDVDSELTALEAKRSKSKGSSNTREVSFGLVDRDSSLLTSSSINYASEPLKPSIQLPEMREDSDVVTMTQGSRKLTDMSDEKDCSRHDCQVEETSEENSSPHVSEQNMNNSNYKPPVKLSQFLSDKKFSKVSGNRDNRPIFVGLSSMGSMGFLEKPGSILKVLDAVLEATNSSAILLTAGYPPLDLAVTEQCDAKLAIQCLDVEQRRNRLLEGLTCFNGRLLCYAGSVPYLWLLPQCSVAIHHGGSGTTAACLRACIPQIICPFVLDQFYWAERMAWLGVAPQPLKPEHLMPALSQPPCESLVEAVKVVSAAITEGLSVELQRCAASLGAKIAAEDGTAVAVRVLRSALNV